MCAFSFNARQRQNERACGVSPQQNPWRVSEPRDSDFDWDVVWCNGNDPCTDTRGFAVQNSCSKPHFRRLPVVQTEMMVTKDFWSRKTLTHSQLTR